MRRILKFKLGPTTRLKLPADAQLLHVQEQDGQLMLWVLAEQNAPLMARIFHVYLTGDEVPDDLTFVGTATFSGGALVYHVFEEE